MTKIAVIVLCLEAILIWAIPPLLPQQLDFLDHNPVHIRPIFTIPFPDGIILHSKLISWKTISSWYFGSSQTLYFESIFDALCRDRKLHRFQIMLKPDLSAASLQVINASEVTPYDFYRKFFQSYRICEDTLVSCLFSHHKCGVYTGLTSARFSNIISRGHPAVKMTLPDIGHEYRHDACPASGGFVLVVKNNTLVVLDVF